MGILASRTENLFIKNLREIRDISTYTWREIAGLPEYKSIPAGTLCVIYKTGEIPEKWRRRLGFPPKGSVVVMSGETIPVGTQVIAASVCDCGQAFISNHPRRVHCFVCSPFRGGRKGARK